MAYLLENSHNKNVHRRYHRTVAQKTLNVVSAPYEDSWGSGKIISLTRAILRG